MTSPTYRTGRHSPINIWAQADGADDVQVAMAISPDWARAIVEALNAAEGRTPPNVSGVDTTLWRQRRAIQGLELFLDYLDQPGVHLSDFPDEPIAQLRRLLNPPSYPHSRDTTHIDPLRRIVLAATSGATARRFATEHRIPFGGAGGEWIYPADTERLRGINGSWLYVIDGYPSTAVQTTVQRMVTAGRLEQLTQEELHAVLAVKQAANEKALTDMVLHPAGDQK